MRICVISSSVFQLPVTGYAGLEVIAWHQAKGLAERGHQVALVAPNGSWCPGVEMIPMGPAGISEEIAYGGNAKDPNRTFAHAGYWQHLQGAEVIISNDWMKFAYMLKAEGVFKGPILGVCHAPVNTMFQKLPPVEKPCMVCISNDQAEHFYNLFGRRARTAYNGADVTGFYKPLGVPRSNRFLFLARFSAIKGPDIAIDACLESGVGLDMVGDTTITNEPELYHHCQRLAGKGTPGQIRIIGNQPRGSCVWWFSQAHALIHANERFREPFGLSPVEAMACGCPVVSWDNGAMRETVKHGETGWLVNSKAELVKAIREVSQTTGAATDAFRQRCVEHAQQFSIENMVSRYEALCREALDGGW